jgi:hypothetical protein
MRNMFWGKEDAVEESSHATSSKTSHCECSKDPNQNQRTRFSRFRIFPSTGKMFEKDQELLRVRKDVRNLETSKIRLRGAVSDMENRLAVADSILKITLGLLQSAITPRGAIMRILGGSGYLQGSNLMTAIPPDKQRPCRSLFGLSITTLSYNELDYAIVDPNAQVEFLSSIARLQKSKDLPSLEERFEIQRCDSCFRDRIAVRGSYNPPRTISRVRARPSSELSDFFVDFPGTRCCRVSICKACWFGNRVDIMLNSWCNANHMQRSVCPTGCKQDFSQDGWWSQDLLTHFTSSIGET